MIFNGSMRNMTSWVWIMYSVKQWKKKRKVVTHTCFFLLLLFCTRPDKSWVPYLFQFVHMFLHLVKQVYNMKMVYVQWKWMTKNESTNEWIARWINEGWKMNKQQDKYSTEFVKIWNRKSSPLTIMSETIKT